MINNFLTIEQIKNLQNNGLKDYPISAYWIAPKGCKPYLKHDNYYDRSDPNIVFTMSLQDIIEYLPGYIIIDNRKQFISINKYENNYYFSLGDIYSIKNNNALEAAYEFLNYYLINYEQKLS